MGKYELKNTRTGKMVDFGSERGYERAKRLAVWEVPKRKPKREPEPSPDPERAEG